ncbi:hypothetical protein CPB83DRAFT_845869 [Crepidotus variabilis]|uniref:NACHT domain-containing protein n=1 Tax=Crepidotus variabilis TaxID=179855 RepID=A0A9P6EQK7_9AGAR|nr:hypothetical protein CPB83DRAFT_845869 [Crepidotus variabilis]
MFNNSNNTIVTGGTFTQIYGSKTTLEILYDKAAPSAFHISDERYDAPKCLPETRVAILEDLLQQVTIAVVSQIIWLHGAAGAGKSSIAQSFAEICNKENLLIGSFFFFRTSPLRNNAKRLAASLAYQLARSIPSTLPHIAACIENHPAIFESSLGDQLEKLFAHPVRQACENTELNHQPRLVILDGLDECATPRIQTHILAVLAKVVQSTPIPLVILIASRPEIDIAVTFDSPSNLSNIQTTLISLNDDYEANSDIRLYVTTKLNGIKRLHRFRKYIPAIWPAPEDVELIVQKSSGQFIFASTIVRHVESVKHKPHERLRSALYASNSGVPQLGNSPFQELDALYLHIFSSVENVVLVLAILYIRLLSGTSVDRSTDQFILRTSHCPRTIASQLCLSPGDVEAYISDLASLIGYEGEDVSIRIYHASLQDFLLDKNRSHQFYITQVPVHALIAKAYLRNIFKGARIHGWPLVYVVDHLIRAYGDDGLATILSNLPAQISRQIEDFRSGEQDDDLSWFEQGSSYSMRFSSLVLDLFELKKAIEIHVDDDNHSFWDRCLDQFNVVFLRDLSVYLVNEATHDFLALLAFMDFENCPFPPLAFAIGLGLTQSTWESCRRAQPFITRANKPSKLASSLCSSIMQEFLLNTELSGRLSINPAQLVRVALKCLTLLSSTSLSHDVQSVDERSSIFKYGSYTEKPTTIPEDQEVYLWAVRALTVTVQHASESRFLIQDLLDFNCQFRWLGNYPEYAEEGEKVITSYLLKHAPSANTATLPPKTSLSC